MPSPVAINPVGNTHREVGGQLPALAWPAPEGAALKVSATLAVAALQLMEAGVAERCVHLTTVCTAPGSGLLCCCVTTNSGRLVRAAGLSEGVA
ncbi:hypothetical protein GCM10023175_00500 [Pseudonocardia xishanensis]|uniref:Uncharacterized protein n=1 Tax=Pseudonocardia xishanensis TaxID=630995 RepID=A0ABP8RCS0_9PSEU